MKKICFSLFAALISTGILAQDDAPVLEEGAETVNKNWYASPWVWIVVAALFIVLLIVLTQNKKDQNKGS